MLRLSEPDQDTLVLAALVDAVYALYGEPEPDADTSADEICHRLRELTASRPRV